MIGKTTGRIPHSFLWHQGLRSVECLPLQRLFPILFVGNPGRWPLGPTHSVHPRLSPHLPPRSQSGPGARHPMRGGRAYTPRQARASSRLHGPAGNALLRIHLSVGIARRIIISAQDSHGALLYLEVAGGVKLGQTITVTDPPDAGAFRQ
jgi:hypothetical protein